MGWNSWNKFRCEINETVMRNAADTILSLGLDTLGYRYVNVDDCWMSNKRDHDGTYQADALKFPSGMRHFSDYLHERRLLFGIYTSAGTIERRV